MKIINLIKIFCLSIVAAVFVAIAFNTSFEKESDKLEITFLDVGQGDCAYIKTPDNYRIMIDTGDEGTYDNYIKAFLGSRKIPYLDAAVVTHFDSDHCRGLYEMLGEKRVDTVYVPLHSEYNYLTDMIYRKCVYNGADYKSIEVGDNIYDGKDGVKIWALFPNDFIYDNKEDVTENNNSLVIMLEYKEKKFLFMGDIEKEVEELLTVYMDLEADVLKVGHHGSKTSSSETFLNEVKPEYSVISCGIDNEYGLPADEIIYRLKEYGSKVYRTDLNGNIMFTIDENGDISVKTSKQGE